MIRTLLLTLLLTTPLVRAGDPFVERGFPAHDREWLPADYEKTAGLFSAPRAELLTLSDETAALYLTRLNSAENFAFVRNKKLPLDQRLSGFSTIQRAHSTILKFYATPAAGKNGPVYPSETAGLIAFEIRLGGEGLALMDEFLPTIPKDEKFEIRMAGLRKAHGGLTTQFQGAVTTLGETEYYSAADRTIILKAVAEMLPTFVKIFTPAYKAELKVTLTGLKEKISSEPDLKLLEGMIRLAGE